MNEQFFQERFPEGYPKSVNVDQYESVVEIFNGFVKKFALDFILFQIALKDHFPIHFLHFECSKNLSFFHHF